MQSFFGVSMKRKKITVLILFFALFFLFTGLQLYMGRRESADFQMENKKESLYKEPPAVFSGQGININTADKETLCTLPGIGPSLSAAIIAYREEHGPFPHPACITEVEGIGKKLYREIQDKICVGE